VKSGLLVCALLAVFPIAAAHAAEVTVTIKNFDYSPMELNIAAGTTVMWKNLDGEPHTIASLDGLFRSQALDQNDSFRFTFEHPGVYEYICSIHPKMKATITVK
jgi:plastocyanin